MRQLANIDNNNGERVHHDRRCAKNTSKGFQSYQTVCEYRFQKRRVCRRIHHRHRLEIFRKAIQEDLPRQGGQHYIQAAPAEHQGSNR